MPAVCAERLISFSQPSPYASANPMYPNVFTPLAFMLTATASAIGASFCGVLNIQRVLGSIGLMIAADAASEIIGVPESTATSRIASELGVVEEPTMTSTLSSLTSLRALVTALVVSD